ncbi:MAG: uroporphyrinogen decarboxylase family protein, partial [Treponema sp.]|nr:uroporphyrinogen decarboxylase family protein [Treponema sp.]
LMRYALCNGFAGPMDLSVYLEDLERRICAADEESLAMQWLSFARCKLHEGYFAPSRPKSAPAVTWPDVNINDCINDIDMMIYQQLKGVSDILSEGGGELLSLRPNYGTGIVPSMYGAEIFIMPRESNTLPGVRTLPGAMTGIRRILDRGEMDFSKALAGRVFDFAERWAEVSLPYTSVRRYVYMYNPDLQGPLPLVELLWGSELYLDIFDERETVCAALGFFTDVIIAFLKKFHALFPPFDSDCSVEWGLLHRGGVIIRNDAVMNISGDMYREFVKPHDQRIISVFGGGIHFCGKGDHYIEHISEIRGISTVNLSQPEYNDMEIIYQNTVDRGIVIIGLPHAEVKRASAAGRNLRGRVHCGAALAAWTDKESK